MNLPVYPTRRPQRSFFYSGQPSQTVGLMVSTVNPTSLGMDGDSSGDPKPPPVTPPTVPPTGAKPPAQKDDKKETPWLAYGLGVASVGLIGFGLWAAFKPKKKRKKRRRR